MPNIVIYGGGPQAVAAAAKAAAQATGSTVYVISPDPTGKLGSIATTGGQNYWDTGPAKKGGTFGYWFGLYDAYYNTDTMANQFLSNLTHYSNIQLRLGYDIYDIAMATNPDRITSVTIRPIYRDSTGVIQWTGSTQVISGLVFIDASEDGKLARLANFAGTTGRLDWPTSDLPSDEQSGYPRQMSATLMFKVTGVQYGVSGDMSWYTTPKGVQGCWGGKSTVSTNPVIGNFNATYGPQGYSIKGVNAAQNGPGSSEWWVNCFLVYNVDARAWKRDQGTWRYPTDKRADYKDQDQAWIDSRNFLKNHASEFLNAIRQFTGFGNVNFVYGSDGYPVTGQIMYVRESVHMAIDSGNRYHGTENTNYRLTTNMVVNSESGGDSANYNHRIGLASYWGIDIHPYKYGSYAQRSDIPLDGAHTVYVPYEVMETLYCANLLLCGYAAGASSAAWGVLRMYPNLTVLGDAAGTAAAYCANYNLPSVYYGDYEIGNVQSMLRTYVGAVLEK